MNTNESIQLTFDEITIQKLFGSEAAEEEDPKRLKEYYFKSKIYERVVVDLPLRILVGHKGIGKSALFKIAIDEEMEKKRLTVLIKPNDIANIGNSSNNFLKLIEDWKNSINEIIVNKVLSQFSKEQDNIPSALKNYGGKIIDYLINTLSPIIKDKINLDKTKEILLEKFLSDNKISIYIDDLDRGWKGREEDIEKISALLNAIRDLSSDNRGLYFKISLRSDVYFLSRTSDESTDKTENAVIWYTWKNHEILVLLVKRIESYFNKIVNDKELLKRHQSQLMNYLTPIIEDRFTGKGHWKDAPMYRVLMSLIRKRPRDLVKILTLAARQADIMGANKIATIHLENIFDEYSQGRLQDTINEYRSELPDIERLILGMRPTKRKNKTATGYIYSTDELIKKIQDIEQQGSFYWANKKKADIKELAAFLYKINFITARKNSNGEIERKYFDESRYLSNKFKDFGYAWEVHPAYRWALQPDNISEIFNELELSAD